jgi:hypothetical protein
LVRNLVTFALLAAAGYLLVGRLSLGSAGITLDGQQVLVETSDFEVRFTRVGHLSGSYMVFGGNNERPTNSVTHAIMATLGMHHAKFIAESYPDFHRCASPGAAQAKRLIEDMSFIGATRNAQRALAKVVDLHTKRIRSGGDRTCVSVSGAELMLDSMHLKHDGRDVTRDFAGAFKHSRFYLAEDVEIPDCQTLL